MRRIAIVAVTLIALTAFPAAGATEQGVSPGEIRLALYNDLGIVGDMNAPWKTTDEGVGHEADHQQRYLVRTIKTLLRYFQARYDTHGRTVRVIARSSQGGIATPCAGRQGDAAKIQIDLEPFAVVAWGGAMDCFADYTASKYGRPVLMLGGAVDARVQARNPGLIWSFLPTLQERAEASATFICRKLAARPVRFTDDPLLRGRERSFGVAYPSLSQRGTYIGSSARALIGGLRTRCGIEPSVETFVDADTMEAPNIMAKWKRLGVTTVICYCVGVPTEMAATKFQASAKALGYLPEWYWDSTVGMDKQMWLQLFADRSMASFGSSHFWRQHALTEQPHYQAYLEGEPETTPNTRFSFDIYHVFLQAFTAVQNAGPAPDPASLEAGLRAWRIEEPGNPFVPRASYDGADSFVDSFTGWWWDPLGTPPGGRQAEGCVRLVQEGFGYLPGTWQEGDDDLFTPVAPCGGFAQTAFP